jgi:molecular chaperone HscB
MSDSSRADTAAPVKCRQCDRPLTQPLVCDFCHALNPIAAGKDYYSLLGLPRQFDVDVEQLRAKFVALSRHAHPDFHSGESAEVKELSLQMSSAINDAYRTLRDPASRAGYLLELLGGRSSAQDKSVPEGFLDTMMMLQEEIADAKAAGDQPQQARLRGVLLIQQEGLMKRIGSLFTQYQEAVGCEAVRRQLLDELRKQINAVSYVRKLLTQLE